MSIARAHNQPSGTLRIDTRRFIVRGMSRTPLAAAVRDAAAAADADSRRTSRGTFVKEAGVAALGLTALGGLRSACARRRSTEDRRRRRRPCRAERRVLAEERRLHRRDPRGIEPDRRSLLDAPRRLCRRSDRRARRRVHRPGAYPDQAARTEPRAQARQPAPGRAERHGAAGLVRRRAVPLTTRCRTTSRRRGRRSTRMSRRRAIRPRSSSRPSGAESSTTCRSSTGSRRPSKVG